MGHNGQSTAAGPGLSGPVYPRFFAGQLLTDRDLTALEQWARARFGLVRYRDGWGVACGLGVRPVRGKPGRLTVTPGYAVDRRGNDLVVDADTAADLPPADDRQAARCPVPGPSPTGQDVTLTIGPWEAVSLRKLAVFDLLLVYSAEDTTPVAGLGDSGGQRCQNSRTREAGKPVFLSRTLEEVGLARKPDPAEPTDPAVKLLRDFQNEPTVGGLFTAILPGTGGIADEAAAVKVRDWVTARLDLDPALSATFPTLRDWVARNGSAEFRTYWGVARVLFWMADAARRSRPGCGAACAGGEAGVPLARVWAELDGGEYQIRFIDDAPPYRRPLGGPDADAWDARAYVGRRSDDVARALAALGVVVNAEPLELPADGDHLLRLLSEETEGTGPLLAPGQTVVALTSRRSHPAPAAADPPRPEPFADRVVAFRRPSVAPARVPVTSPATALEVQAYRAAAAAEVAPAFAPKPADDQALKVDALPAGGYVTLAATLKDADLTTAGKTFAVFWHDELRNRVLSVGGTPGANPVVVTLKVPDGATPRDSVRASLVVLETVSGLSRLLAVSGPVVSGAPNHPVLPVIALDLKSTPPALKIVVPLTTSTGNETAVFGSKFPIEVRMANPSPSRVKGTLRFAKTKPTTPATDGTALGAVAQDPKKKIDDKVVSETGVSTPYFPVTPDAGPTEGWFWIAAGTDEFQRTFSVDPEVFPQLRLRTLDLTVAVHNVNDTGPSDQKSQLTLTNNETKPITVKAVRFGTVDGLSIGPDVTPASPGNTLAQHGGLAPIDMPKPARPKWRIGIDLTFDGHDLSGAVDVDAT